MNLIMKKVTSWAAIIAVPTAITGWYGQNVPYPGFGKTSGLIASTRPHRGAGGRALRPVPPQGLALNRAPAFAATAPPTVLLEGDEVW